MIMKLMNIYHKKMCARSKYAVFSYVFGRLNRIVKSEQGEYR